jgi:hypothetical protein
MQGSTCHRDKTKFYSVALKQKSKITQETVRKSLSFHAISDITGVMCAPNSRPGVSAWA